MKKSLRQSGHRDLSVYGGIEYEDTTIYTTAFSITETAYTFAMQKYTLFALDLQHFPLL